MHWAETLLTAFLRSAARDAWNAIELRRSAGTLSRDFGRHLPTLIACERVIRATDRALGLGPQGQQL